MCVLVCEKKKNSMFAQCPRRHFSDISCYSARTDALSVRKSVIHCDSHYYDRCTTYDSSNIYIINSWIYHEIV